MWRVGADCRVAGGCFRCGCRLKDKQADGVSKVLEAKDEADRAVAITAAEKLAKKLKKGKKK